MTIDDASKNIQNTYSGKQGENGFLSEYEKIWDKLKNDIGIINIILLFLGSILLIFSPDKGWEFHLPCFNYILAYRGWLGVLCFIIVLISKCCGKVFAKGKKTIFNTAQASLETGEISQKTVMPDDSQTKNELLFKSMYVHFSSDKFNNLFSMCAQLNLCKDHTSAMLLLFYFQKLFNGKLYFSPFPQFSAVEKKNNAKGESDKDWYWWYWDGGVAGFQLIVSLCQ
jgi:hypothetical protein